MIKFDTEHSASWDETLVFVTTESGERALFLAFRSEAAAKEVTAFFNRLAAEDATLRSVSQTPAIL